MSGPVYDTVLIVEDNADDRALLARAFNRLDASPALTFAEDGQQALDLLGPNSGEAGALRLILLDLKLPRRSGFEVLEHVKGHPDLRRVPVVILTSSRETVDLKRAYDLGANSYLVKPAAPRALAELVARVNTYWLETNEDARLDG